MNKQHRHKESAREQIACQVGFIGGLITATVLGMTLSATPNWVDDAVDWLPIAAGAGWVTTLAGLTAWCRCTRPLPRETGAMTSGIGLAFGIAVITVLAGGMTQAESHATGRDGSATEKTDARDR